MRLTEKLQLILQLSGLTQATLAHELGVSFATLNRWINGHAIPRKSAERKINETYKVHTGVGDAPYTVSTVKLAVIEKKRTTHRNAIKEILAFPDIRDAFLLALTYHTNRIEGSTLTEAETAAILFEHASPPHKTLIEQLEAKNHQAALEFTFAHIAQKHPISEAFILRCHEILLNAIRDDAGMYRVHPVRIVGANVPTANYVSVPKRMVALMRRIHQKRITNIVEHVATVHAEFEQIHPFADGNGRVGRLLMHAMLLRNQYPPAVLRQQKRKQYMRALRTAQIQGDTNALCEVVADSILLGYLMLERKGA